MAVRSNAVALKAAAAYNAAADHFDKAPLGFWDLHSKRAVERLRLKAGARVLDVGCGTGASALPAAAAVGAGGSVLGIDVAENMLACARAKAAAQGLDNVSFEARDMTASGLPDAHFDAVIAVFAIFFVEDMEGLIRELWRMVKPGGKLAVTTWGPRAFKPCADMFMEEIFRLQPDRAPAPLPWERLTDPEDLRRLFIDGGAEAPLIEPVLHKQPLRTPEDWWTAAMGSGYRWEIDQLSDEERIRVRAANLRRIAEEGVDAFEANAIHGVSRKSA